MKFDPRRELARRRLLAVLQVVAYLASLLPLSVIGAQTARADHLDVCYFVDDADDELTMLDRGTLVETIVGPLGVSDVETIAMNPNTGVLYTANGGSFGTIDLGSGAFTAIGPMGVGGGSAGNETFDNVDGLTYDDANGFIYGSEVRTGADALFRINPTTGAHVPDAFGPGVDYVLIATFTSVDDLAADPTTGILYGTDTTGLGSSIFTIDPSDGSTSLVGLTVLPTTDDFEGLAFDLTGQLVATNGTSPRFFEVDKTNATPTFITDLGSSLDDYESVECLPAGVGEADLELIKTVDNAAPLIGTNVIYTVTVTNNGPHDASNVEITDQLPGGVTYVSDDSGGAYNSGTGVWTIGSILNGGSAAIDITVTSNSPGTIINTAEVTAVNQNDPDSTPDNGVPSEDDQDSAVIGVIAPSVDLVKTADTSGGLTVGDTVSYDFEVTNDGNVTLTSIDVTDPLPGLSAISCPANTLAPGASTSCTATYVITQADVDNGQLDNTATVTSEDATGTNPTDIDSESVTIPQVPSIDVVKSADTSGGLTVGDTVSYDFDVANDGDVTLTSVGVSDPLPGLSAINCPATTLAPGVSTTCTATYVITQTDVDNGSIDNTATATGTPPSGPDVTDQDTETVIIPQSPSIDLEKTSDTTGGTSIGDTITYEFDVTNDGNATLTSITVTDPLPGLSAISCPVTTLGPGAFTTCTATYVIAQSDVDNGSIDNTATATGTPPSGPDVEDTASLTTSLDPMPDITIDKRLAANADEDGSGGVTSGDTLTYEVEVSNTGNVTLSNVAIVDSLPGLSPLTCTPDLPTTLLPGEGITCSATYVVADDDATTGQVLNTATVTSEDQTGTNPSATDTETVDVVSTGPVVDVSIVKTASPVEPDGSVAWTLRVTNNGPDTAPGPVTVSDAMPDELSIVAATGIGWSCMLSGQSIECVHAADLVGGQESVIEISSNIDESQVASGDVVTNTASVRLANSVAETDLTNNEDADSITIGTLPFTGLDFGPGALLSVLMILSGLVLIVFAKKTSI